ncbi:MAG: hypothetical protein MK001_03730 [Alcanivorax sp.]|nr:hypothetical protein [Alcanivorax sp.]
MSDTLQQILEELRAQRVQESLWSTEEVGAYFGVKSKTACGIVAAPDFPDPVTAPGVGRRWLPEEVRAWAKRHRKPKRRA